MKLPTTELWLELRQDRLLKAHASLVLSISPLVDSCACHERLTLPYHAKFSRTQPVQPVLQTPSLGAQRFRGGEGTRGCFSGAAGWYFQLDTSTAAQYFHSWVVVCTVCAPLMPVCKPSSAWVHLVNLLFQSCVVACAIAGFPIQLGLTDLGPRHAEGDELVGTD